MTSEARLEADVLIDQIAALPAERQPLWFTEMFKDWEVGVSTSEDYSSPDGTPDELIDDEDDLDPLRPLCQLCGMDQFCLCDEDDEEFDDEDED